MISQNMTLFYIGLQRHFLLLKENDSEALKMPHKSLQPKVTISAAGNDDGILPDSM